MVSRAPSWIPGSLLAFAAGIGALVVLVIVTLWTNGRIGDAPTGEPWLVSTKEGRLILAAVALAVWALSFRAWRRRGAAGRVGNIGVALILGLLSGLGAAVGTTIAIFTFTSLGDRPTDTEPESFLAACMALGLLLLAIATAVLLMVYAWWRRIEGGHPFPFFAFSPLVALLALGWVVSALKDEPHAEDSAAQQRRAALERNIQLEHQVILLIDPGEPAGRRLIRLARSKQRGINRRREKVAPWKLATGVAVPARGAARWKLIQRPADRKRLVGALAAIAPQERAAGARQHGEALRSLMSGRAGRWRKGPVRSVALVFDRLPNVGLPGRRTRSAGWTGVLSSLPPPVSPATGDERRGVVALHVVAAHASDTRRRRWRKWTAKSGGTLTMPSRFSDDQHVIDSAEDAATGRAGAEDRRLAGAFRPHLKFDRKEKYRPLDVDAYLSETGGADEPRRLCRRQQLQDDECVSVLKPQDLQANYDYLELPDNANPDVGRDPPPRERIYYRRTDEVDPETKQVSRVQLDYWWFFRFNASPVAAEFMCLRGLAIKETTCFDHDGDWEGITVTLKRADAGSSTRWEGESVTYAGHKWRYRYAWPVLDDVGVIEDETHPTVYVARGSHASYPASCHTQDTTKPRSCRQLGSVVPDGKRNGATAWDHNTRCRSCLLELPTDQYGTAARWNAFGGRWGAAACTYGLKLCVRGDGPRSPAYQSRYKDPAVSDPGPVCDLYKRSGMRCPPLPSGKPVAHTGRAHPAAPGLYFNGYLLPLSGQLPAMRRTSRRIARAIAAAPRGATTGVRERPRVRGLSR